MTGLFTTLLLAHLLGDFPLQTSRIFKLKLKGGFHLLPHVLIHVVVTGILLRNFDEVWPLLLSLGISHFFIDWFKVTTSIVSPDIDFLIDQAMHIFSLMLIAFLFPIAKPVLPMALTFWGSLFSIFPALMMFIWIYAMTIATKDPIIIWMQDSMLLISKRTGWLITVGLFKIAFIILF